MPRSVGCTVDSCMFNCNCKCNADNIEVKKSSTKNAKTSFETECQTFMPK